MFNFLNSLFAHVEILMFHPFNFDYLILLDEVRVNFGQGGGLYDSTSPDLHLDRQDINRKIQESLVLGHLRQKLEGKLGLTFDFQVEKPGARNTKLLQ